LRAEAGGEELRAIRLAEIEVNIFRRRLVAGRLPVEPLKRIWLFAGTRLVEVIGGIGKLRGELGDKVGGDFVAARANGRADGGEQLRRLAAEFELHATDGLLRDAGEGAAPAGVDGGNGSVFWIDKEKGNAVCSLHAKQDARAIGGGGVALRWGGGVLGNNVHDVRVDLFEGKELMGGGAQGGLKFAAIFGDCFLGVPFHVAEVENFFGFELTSAAGTRAEAVDEPGKPVERREFEDLQALRFTEAPGCGDRRAVCG